MALNMEKQQRIVKACGLQFDAGASEEEALHFCVQEEHRLTGGFDGPELKLAVSQVYKYLRANRKPKTPNREAQSLALYDALVALGWTPPHE